MDFNSYYLNQANNVNSAYFRGTPFQKGYGLGGAFRSFFRWALPLFKPIAQNLGRDIIKNVAEIASDAVSGKNTIKESVEKKIKHYSNQSGGKRNLKIKKDFFKAKKQIKKKSQNEIRIYLIKMVLDCIKSELDLFVEPQTNTSIESGKWADYYPISSLDDGPIDFVVHASEHYIQLNKTMLYLNVSISNFENTSECAPINNLASSLFSTVSLTLNDTVIENSNGYYPYKSYLLDLLNQDEESKNSILQSALYFKDDAGQFDNTKLVKDETNKTPVNSGFVQRRQFFVSSKNSVDLYSKLNLDLFNSDKYLINNVTIRLRLIQNNAVFYMLCNKNKTFSIKINKCQLFIRKVKISPAIIVAHNLALEKATAKYPIKRVVVTSLQIQLGIKETIFSNICLGPLPNRIVLGLVESDAQSGNYEKNPFNFLHFNLAKISLTLESTEIPYGQPLEFNYQKNNYIRGYHSLFEGIDKPFGTGNDISRSEYPNGYCLYAFDLTPDLCSSEHINLVKTGELSVKLSFSENTDKVLSLIILKEFDNLVECSYSRQFGINFQT